MDYSSEGAELALEEWMPDNLPGEKLENIKRTRWAIVNLWRPLAPISRDSLALCDARSVADGDLVPFQTHFQKNKTYKVSTKSGKLRAYEVRANPTTHKWYFASKMQPTEALLLKQFDSSATVARRSPHTGFSSSEDYGPPRQSIEVRCLVLFDDQPAQ